MVMEELEEIWFDTELAANGLDEYLTMLFKELEAAITSSNVKNFEIVE